MNEHESKTPPSEQPTAQPAATAKPAGGGMSPLRIVLILILVAMIAALAYDWAVALPASQEAAAEIEKLVTESASRPADQPQASPADVQELVGHAPSGEVFDGGHYIVEEYHWTRGLPVLKPYYIKVVYNKRKGGEELTLANVVWNQELEDISIPGGPVEVPTHTPSVEDGETPDVDPAQSEGEEPAVPGSEEPAPTEEPATEEPATEEPATEEPVAEEPVTEEPVTEEPVAEEPVAEEPVAEEPATEAPAAEEPVAEEPAAEEPANEAADAEEAPAVVEEPVEE